MEEKSAFDPATQKVVIPSNVNPNGQLLTPQLLNLFSDRPGVYRQSEIALVNSAG